MRNYELIYVAPIEYHAKSTIYHITPSNSTTIVDWYPSGATEWITDHILNRHISSESRPISYIGCFSERAVCSTNIVVIATNNYGTLKTNIIIAPLLFKKLFET